MISIQNINDKECFKWSLVRYLNPADCKTARSKNVDEEFAKKFDFKDIKFPVKIRDIHKNKTKIRKNIQFMFQKCFRKKNMLINY